MPSQGSDSATSAIADEKAVISRMQTYLAQTNLVVSPGGFYRKILPQPAAVSKPLKYLPCRDAISSLVLLERAEFGTRPAIKVGCKFNAGGVEERPSQMIDIHGADHQGPDDVGQSATNVSCR